MPDTMKAVGQAMDQEAANELVRRERHHPWRVAVSVIAPAEGDGGVVGADQAAVGDGDAVRVSTPFSSRCVAKLWRSVWTLTRLTRPAAFVADRQAA